MKYDIISERSGPVVFVRSPKDLVPHLRRYSNKKQEFFLLATLDGAHNLLKVHVVTIGLLNRTLIHPREIFIRAIKDNSASVILAHNHPSGSLEASKEDHDATARIVGAGKLLGIPVIDHLIVGKSGYYSFQENGELT